MSEKKRKPGPSSLTTPPPKASQSPYRRGSSLSRPTLDREAAERLIDAWLAPLARTTRANYRQGLRRLTAFLDGEAAPKAEASPGEGALALLMMSRHEATGTIERWAVAMVEEGLSAPSVQTHVRSALSFSSYADAARGIGPGPLSPRMRASRERKIRPAPTLAEVARAVLRCREAGGPRGARDEAALQIALGLALRRSELQGLAWADVDWGTGIVRVTRKGAKRQALQAPEQALAALRSWREHCGGEQAEGYVFRLVRGENVQPDPVGSTYLYNLCRSLDLGGAHRLRRTAARWISQHGGEGMQPASVDHVRQALGHSDLRTTVEYLDSGEDEAGPSRSRLMLRLAEVMAEAQRMKGKR
jgi:integrase/recombinase XerC